MLSEMQRERADMLIRRKYKRYFKHKMTYLGLISYAIQNAPEKRLTFIELKNAVAMFVDGDRKGLENNIRVCLSSNNCFVKVPVNPECPNAKRNFWKLDESKITPKILRRHFSGLRDVFPAFYENIKILSARNAIESKPATCKLSEAKKKFTSSFSIESLLERESSASRRPFRATRNSENDRALAFKRKTWDWPNQTAYANFSRSYLNISVPTHNLGHINNVCSPNNRLPKRMCSVSELSHCTAHDSIKRYTSNAVTWAYT